MLCLSTSTIHKKAPGNKHNHGWRDRLNSASMGQKTDGPVRFLNPEICTTRTRACLSRGLRWGQEHVDRAAFLLFLHVKGNPGRHLEKPVLELGGGRGCARARIGGGDGGRGTRVNPHQTRETRREGGAPYQVRDSVRQKHVWVSLTHQVIRHTGSWSRGCPVARKSSKLYTHPSRQRQRRLMQIPGYSVFK